MRRFQKILLMMQTVVDSGTAKKATRKYTVAGKTGTVRIIKDGKYMKDSHLAIFVGITPVAYPEYVTAIIVRNLKMVKHQEEKMQHLYIEVYDHIELIRGIS